MSSFLRGGLCALAAVALAGCASSGGVASSPAGRTIGPSVHPQWVDAEYIAAVERYARRTGAVVQWVNPPPARTVASTSP